MILKLESHDITLTALSPIHIGCGEDFTPHNSILHVFKGKSSGQTAYELMEFDPLSLLKILPGVEQAKLLHAMECAQTVDALQRIYEPYHDVIKKMATSIIPVVPELGREIWEKRGRVVQEEGRHSKVLNQLAIDRHIRSNGRVYIPGSSLKGAIKTAYFQAMMGKYKPVEPSWEGIKKKFGAFENDPFTHFGIGDLIPTNSIPTFISYAVNISRKSKEIKNLSTKLEVINPQITFSGNLRFNRSQQLPLPNGLPENSFTKVGFIQTVNDFYLTHAQRELDWLQEMHPTQSHAKTDLSSWMQKAKEGKGCLIKLGKHSGAESLTLEGLRRIKVRLGKETKEMPKGTTYWLNSWSSKILDKGCFFGWAWLQFHN
jgi:CRISPR-associated protein Csm5